MEDVDVVLLGETHDDRIAHLLQLQLLRGAQQQSSRTGRPVALSLEMFERDVQGIMDDYLSGLITERDLKQAYLDKTNQTMQAAAEQIQAFKSQQAGEGGSDKSAGKKETKDDGLPLPADSGEAADLSAPRSYAIEHPL
ncbi:hypothetical protein COCSUDRAFT_59236 [Coccomyxa subellipsoidea C-169]|uniref:Haem-binding uptake Tiki superfamily ChaN domain-containing protein n=1 Tax=Coccomyxa subellipsoidea (strain C-169) TaxID=574566 RepID=I0Z7V0_COCSC|nr:hypothetical protein COCSUDRAFT_59236 [Coccomyxa subellipsoidea C-169]EIE26719.1 hypothetical protein COCSUDRAFT_59236 [Coccomyxa subellipsoidea C-169]|eukprot:XP_005651263.1 hypothetical protein COCSUDRAFT_59236 [Coccomyxa subellipsoidea C-169]